jgi:hypothetical protein
MDITVDMPTGYALYPFRTGSDGFESFHDKMCLCIHNFITHAEPFCYVKQLAFQRIL